MARVLIDSRFYGHPDVLEATGPGTHGALGVWIALACWYAKHGDGRPVIGWVPASAALAVAGHRHAPLWVLVRARLLEEEQGWFMHQGRRRGNLPADPLSRRTFPDGRVSGYRLRHGPGFSPNPLWDIERNDQTRARIPDQLRQTVYARDGFACVTCGSTEDLSLDHIHPWSKGGKDTLENLQTMCRPCNSRKGVRV